ncbi:zinc ribbon domain-containing protein [Oribacterium sp. WCC10]|uniref:zinc ribbon domain-containing protein n=1 Tax=Oribacterium sp. WCC10 TaxID=1855343 RepID=UPI0008EBF82B|nr:zinc ribbon domain-containing protein [Oribacterium sp. WCC10]SFG42754.1 Double zinc ribbon [Oribacterium sp. WCC10]
MKCPRCGADISDNTQNCPCCHTPIVKIKPLRVCTNCGSEVPDDADKCPGCGRTVRRRTHQTSGKSTGSDTVPGKSAAGNSTLINDIKKEKFAWLQATVPAILAIAYHLLVLRNNLIFNLMNTFIIYEALVFIFGYLDIKNLNTRPEMMEGLVFSEKFIYMSYFLPILSLWERKHLPGMNRRALYPLIHAVLFTILIVTVMITMDSDAINNVHSNGIYMG